jgi:hypothetical protein
MTSVHKSSPIECTGHMPEVLFRMLGVDRVICFRTVNVRGLKLEFWYDISLTYACGAA